MTNKYGDTHGIRQAYDKAIETMYKCGVSFENVTVMVSFRTNRATLTFTKVYATRNFSGVERVISDEVKEVIKVLKSHGVKSKVNTVFNRRKYNNILVYAII